MSHLIQIPDLDSAPAPGKGPGSIGFMRFAELPGVEVMDVRQVSRKWAYFHETYSFCIVSRLADPRDVAWRYRRRTHLMRPNGVQMMEPGELHANLQVAPHADFRVLLLAPAVVREACRDLGLPDRVPHLAAAQLYGGPVREVLRRLTASIVDAGDWERAELGVHRLLQTLWQTNCLEAGHPPGRREQGRRAVSAARDLVHASWNRHLPISQLTMEVGLPLSTLERLFRATFGTSPRQYQLHLRLVRAKELLRGGEDPIVEIARRCRFQDPKYFARLFKREFGGPPSDYRRVRIR